MSDIRKLIPLLFDENIAVVNNALLAIDCLMPKYKFYHDMYRTEVIARICEYAAYSPTLYGKINALSVLIKLLELSMNF